MKHFKLMALALAAAGFAGSALADGHGEGHKLTVTGDVHGVSAYNFRGEQFSANEPSIGFGVKAATSCGAYALYDVNTVKLANPQTGALDTGRGQLHQGLTVGFAKKLKDQLTLGGGITKNFFSGYDSVSDLAFAEVFGEAEWNGVKAKVSYNIEGAPAARPGYSHGDRYAEVGYTYRFGPADRYSLGGDLGYHWYENATNDPLVRDGTSVVNLRAGYAVNEHLGFGITHQVGGRDAYGQDWTGNSTTMVDAKYRF